MYNIPSMDSKKRGRGRELSPGAAVAATTTTQQATLERLIEPDFEELSRQFPAFGSAWREVEVTRKAAHQNLSSSVTQSFSVALTKALLHVHLGVSLTNVPDENLCPPVPNRYFYVHWLQQTVVPLLQNEEYFHKGVTTRETDFTTGLDLGTGAVGIYALLWCASCPTARMFATDIDAASIDSAQANVDSNPSLRSKIQLLAVDGSYRQSLRRPNDATVVTQHGRIGANDTNDVFPVGPLRRSLDAIPQQTQPLDFSMTNPPFYDVGELESRMDDRPRTAMTSHEGCYPGGEVGFGLDMIVDGLYLLHQHSIINASDSHTHRPPGWTSTMCGKKPSWVLLKHVVMQLLGPAHVCSTEFEPGKLTRWFLAWTFQRPSIRSPLAKLPEWSFEVAVAIGETKSACQTVVERIQEYCRSFPDEQLCCQVADEKNPLLLHIFESTVSSPPWKGDEALPEPIQKALEHMDPRIRVDLLPLEGHFLLDVSVCASTNSSQTVQVQVDSYFHSAQGKKVVEKIKSQFEGEIGRTTRRWRRQKEREQKQLHDASMNGAIWGS